MTEGGWRTLITSATALEGPKVDRPRSDFTLAEMRSGADLYFAQSENRAGGDVVYRMRVQDFGPNRFVVRIENASPVQPLSCHAVQSRRSRFRCTFLSAQGQGVWAITASPGPKTASFRGSPCRRPLTSIALWRSTGISSAKRNPSLTPSRA